MRRMNNLVTLFTAAVAFLFGSFIASVLFNIDECPTKSEIVKAHPEIFLLIFVISDPHNKDKRDAIRETWLKLGRPLRQPYYPEAFIYLPAYERRSLKLESTSDQEEFLRNDWKWNTENHEISQERNIKVKHVFAIGTRNLNAAKRSALQKENAKYDDLLLLTNTFDEYSNLTLKVLDGINALINNYEFSYLLKVDDDTYVKLDKLLNELVSYDRKLLRQLNKKYKNVPAPQLYWGYFNGRAKIKTSGHWAENDYTLSDRYIPYALGGGYVLSHKHCEFIAKYSTELSAYVSEDVSVGTWMSPFSYVYRRHDPRFDTGFMPRKCNPQHIVLHKRNINQMRELFAGKLCSSVYQANLKTAAPAEYLYDWYSKPDKCCDTPSVRF